MADESLAEDAWYARVRDLLVTAYLAEDDPQGQSGLGGDAAHWDLRRHVIVEAIERDGSFLDVGCANGLLMETMYAWAAARGFRLEPYGMDISERLAALACARLPHWQGRIFVGNAIDWQPPCRFDYVRTELVYVPERRQRQFVERLLNSVVAPGGRLIVCAYRERGTRDAVAVGEVIRTWGFPITGEADALDPTDNTIATRVVWIDAPSQTNSG